MEEVEKRCGLGRLKEREIKELKEIMKEGIKREGKEGRSG